MIERISQKFLPTQQKPFPLGSDLSNSPSECLLLRKEGPSQNPEGFQVVTLIAGKLPDRVA